MSNCTLVVILRSRSFMANGTIYRYGLKITRVCETVFSGLLFLRSFIDTVELEACSKGMRVSITANCISSGYSCGSESGEAVNPR